MLKPNISIILSSVGNCSDRYCPEYSNPFTIEQLFDRTMKIDGVSGVELIGSTHITSKNVDEVNENLKRTGLKAVAIIPNHTADKIWKLGAFSSKDAGIRRKAVAHTKEMIDCALKVGCSHINLWPGQDGYDYHFQSDYIKERTWFAEGIAECCDYNSKMKIAIEYKPKEPRTRSYASNIYSTLLIVNEINKQNCGIVIDYGHALMGYENVAESIAISKKYGDKLFHFHINDNYGLWDDDMIAGTVHTISYIEMFYWLKKIMYKGWISIDQYPYREDGKEAVTETVRWTKTYIDLVNKLDNKVVEEIINTGDACKSSKFIREILFGR